MRAQRGARRALVVDKILQVLAEGAVLSTPAIRDAVCTPRHLLFGAHALPYEQQIWSTHVYPALVALEKRGEVGRINPDYSHSAVRWFRTDTPPTEPEPALGFEPVDLDALVDAPLSASRGDGGAPMRGGWGHHR